MIPYEPPESVWSESGTGIEHLCDNERDGGLSTCHAIMRGGPQVRLSPGLGADCVTEAKAVSSRYLTPEEQKARFWAKVEKTETCWLWTGALFTQGYGCVSIWRKVKKAHRVAWEWANGPIPEGLTLDHLCAVRRCVRPDHMEPVTAAENSRRGTYRKYGASHDRCRWGHPRQPGETRGCPTCRERIRARDRAKPRGRHRTRRSAADIAVARQLARIGDMLFHPERHGFATRDDVIASLWPTEPGKAA